MKSSSAALLLALLPPLLAPPIQDPGARGGEPSSDGEAALEAAFRGAGVRIDRARGLAAIPARVAIRHDLLEYLLCGAAGATHEALLVTDALPSLLNAAMLALGVEQGRNATWVPREPPPSDEERAAGVDPYDLRLPEGDGFLPYVAWRGGGERFLFRAEDLLANLRVDRSMRRHRWVYIGSRFAQVRRDEPEQFVADVEQNLINLAFFHEGNTLITSALPECADQTIWIANPWLVPPSGSPVWLVLAREDIAELPADWWQAMPELAVDEGASAGARR